MEDFSSGDLHIKYDKKVSRRAKRPKLRFSRSRGFMLTVPERLKDRFKPREFLEDNLEWLEKRKKEYKEYNKKTPERDFRDGSRIEMMDEVFLIDVGDYQGHSLSGHRIKISKRYAETEKDVKKAVENVLRERAREIFEKKLEKITETLETDYEKLYIRDQKTKWGSCSRKKNINLNWRLILGPEKIIDYVLTHEAVHLKIPDHSKRFWNKLEKLIPDYRQRKRWLEEKSYMLEF